MAKNSNAWLSELLQTPGTRYLSDERHPQHRRRRPAVCVPGEFICCSTDALIAPGSLTETRKNELVFYRSQPERSPTTRGLSRVPGLTQTLPGTASLTAPLNDYITAIAWFFQRFPGDRLRRW